MQRCIEACTSKGDWVLDPFLGGGTTAVASRTGRNFVGIELDAQHLDLATKRSDREIVESILRTLRVRVEIAVTDRVRHSVRAETWQDTNGARGATRPTHEFDQIDIDLFSGTINGSRDMAEKPATQTERIFHETKFVFLSCAQRLIEPHSGSAERGSVTRSRFARQKRLDRF